MTCNLGMWRSDFDRAGGFDEAYVGWGYEDSDLVIRLFRTGVKRKDGRFATGVIHLWHEPNDQRSSGQNLKRLFTVSGEWRDWPIRSESLARPSKHCRQMTLPAPRAASH
jgi:N-terminal domain of galactosyltransferase